MLLVVIGVVVLLTGWFGYTIWHSSMQTPSEWRSADEEMLRLLTQQSEAKQSKLKGVTDAQAKDAQQTRTPAEKSGMKQASTDEPAAAEPSNPIGYETTKKESSKPEKYENNETLPKSASDTKSKSGPIGILNLNKATVDQLTTLPGIGESKANAILLYRNQLGGRFKTVEQLLDVKGIGDKVLAKIKPYLTIEP